MSVLSVAFSIMGFNSHPYVRGDSLYPAVEALSESFNSHPYVRGDSNLISLCDKCHVSIHTPT